MENECAVPVFAAPGAHVWARGWFAGCGGWFKARVVKVCPNFPRVHVCYLEDSTGNRGALCLPPMDAYLCTTDLRVGRLCLIGSPKFQRPTLLQVAGA